jgi:hypothetical protein
MLVAADPAAGVLKGDSLRSRLGAGSRAAGENASLRDDAVGRGGLNAY